MLARQNSKHEEIVCLLLKIKPQKKQTKTTQPKTKNPTKQKQTGKPTSLSASLDYYSQEVSSVSYHYKSAFPKEMTVCTGEGSLRTVGQTVLSLFPTAI